MPEGNSSHVSPRRSVFISHASAQKQTAERIAVRLRARGCSPFLDRDSLPSGEEYDQRLRRAVMECELFVFLVSPDSIGTGSYARTELGYAEDRWADPSRRVLPVMVAPTDLSLVPAYLSALVIMQPEGDPVAETVNRVLELLCAPVESLPTTERKLGKKELLALLRGGEDGVRSWNELGNCGVDLSSIDLSGVDLRKADLREADLRKANFRKADLREADLREADLREANLREANLREANLREADLREANLRKADLHAADLFGVALADADRRAAKINKATCANSNWSRIDVLEWKQAGAVLDDDLTDLIRTQSLTSYQPYRATDIEKLQELTRARERRIGTPAERDERQKHIDELVASLKRSPLCGDVVTGCKLVRILGKGNYGVVWQAVDQKTGAQRAVKVFDSDRLGLSTSLYHFRRGVRAMKHLNDIAHRPNSIVKLYDAEESHLAFSMTHLDGGDLSNIAERGWTLKNKLRIFESVCNAVQFAHDNDVIHRDIKPANIVMHGGDSVLTDFDIADLLFAKTKSAQAVGTVTYAAPEALRGKGHAAPSVDVYSLGRLLSFLIAEEDPPLRFEEVPALKELESLLDRDNRWIARIVGKCTMLSPEKRYQTVAELLQDLGRNVGELYLVGGITWTAGSHDETALQNSDLPAPSPQYGPTPSPQPSPTRRPERVIGIDLGTTNSCVAIMEGDSAFVIPNRGGYKTTPTIVAVNGAGNRLVGHIAKRQAITNAENTVYAAKRLIGRKWNSPQVRNALLSCAYTIIEGPHQELRVKLREKTYSVPEVTSMVLQEMKIIAEDYLGEPISKAVVTVPAYFNDNQRQATKDAGQIAGIDVIRIINEPTAASLAHGFGKGRDKTVIVYDIGGCTFDVSVLEIGSHGVFKLIANTGDTFLGGEDFDLRIIDWLIEGFLESHSVDLRRDRMALQRLRDAAEKAKCELSSAAQTEINLPYIAALSHNEGLHLQRSISRQTLEFLSTDLIQRTIQICTAALTEAKLDVNDLDEVILVGGMTQMPAIRRAVAEFFGREPNVSVPPDEAVALGAAIQGAALVDDTHTSVLLHVTPHALGVVTAGGTFEELIPQNTTVPTSRTKVFTTGRDNQTAVKILVMQGESAMAEDNELLGEFVLTGLRRAPKGAVSIEATFTVDSEGIVGVSAKDLETGQVQSLQVTASSGLTEDEIRSMIGNGHSHLGKRDSGQQFEKVRKEAESLVAELERLLPEVDRVASGSDFGRDALAKARSVLNKSRDALTRKDLAAVNEQVEMLVRTQRLFKGVLSREPASVP